MDQPLIVIVGATGAQGGSVIRALHQTHRFRLRAVTRNPESDAAKELAEMEGVEVVRGDATDAASIQAAFQGAWAAYLVTNFWDPANKLAHDTDWVQGKTLVDGAIAAGVKYLVWSSLHDVLAISGGTLHASHYTNKHRVEDYIVEKGIPAAFVYLGFYTTNFPDQIKPVRHPDGSIHIYTPMRADVALPMIDAQHDLGQFVAPMFLEADKFTGQRVYAASEYLTVSQMADAYTRATGEPIQLHPVDPSVLPVPEMVDFVHYLNRYGYYNGEMFEPTQALYPSLKLQKFEDWVRRTGYRV